MKKIDLEINGKELKVYMADSFASRFRGLMLQPKDSLPLGTGLLIAPCNSIHMMFMRFPIDVVYIDKNYQVLKQVPNVRPWLGLSTCWHKNTWATLELPVGSIKAYGIQVGSIIGVSLYYFA